MKVKVSSRITIKVGEMSMELDRETASKLYNALKVELGIVDNNWVYPYNPTWTNPTWTSDKTEPLFPDEPYTTCNTTEGSTALAEAEEFNTNVDNFLNAANELEELQEDINAFNVFSDMMTENLLEGLNGLTVRTIHESDKEIDEFKEAVDKYNRDVFI